MKRTVIFFLAMMMSVVYYSTIFAQDNTAFIRRVRFIETDVLGIPNPAGLSFSRKENIFYVLPRSKPRLSDIFMLTLTEDLDGTVHIADKIGDPINMAFDYKANRLLIFNSTAKQLIEVLVGPDDNLNLNTLTHHDARHFGLQNPQGMTVDPESGHLFILDAAGPWLVRVEPEPDGDFANAVISQVDLQITGVVDLRGLALDPTTGHFHVLDTYEQKLYELTEAGQMVMTRDVSEFKLNDPQGMVFAASGDLTDDPSLVSLYVADSGLSTQEMPIPNPTQNGQIVELSFAGAVVSKTIEAQVAQAAQAAQAAQGSLVQVIDTSQFSSPSPDPAGIAYLSSSDKLLICDSEVDEMSIFAGANLFEMTLSGIVTDTAVTAPFSNEPTGATFNPDNGHLFFSDDNIREIFELSPGNDGVFFTADDTLSFFDTGAFNSFDPEGVAFARELNALFIADGENNEVYQITPGLNNIFDGVPPSGDDQVTHFDTARLGVLDPEGIVFDSDSGNLYIVGEPTDSVFVVTTTGILVQVIDISASNAWAPAGLALAPGSQNHTAMNLYITDRGVDNNDDPNENDGKVYEMSLQLPTSGNERPTVDAGPDQTISLPDSAILNGTVTDDGLPDPPAVVTTTWSQLSGPGTVTFTDASAVSTTSSFSQAGTYVLQLTANDGELVTSDDVTIFVAGAGGEQVIEVQVAAGSDDAEEVFSGGMQLSSTDLDLGSKTVGVRFSSVNIPQGASIINAYLQFQADEIGTAASSLTIEGQDADDAPTFTGAGGDITSRSRTITTVSWSPAPWTSAGAVGPDQRTPNIALIIEEIVSRPFWSSGNSLVLIITGSGGERAAYSREGNQAGAPLLHVEYTLGAGTNQPPTAVINAPADGATFNEGDSITFTGAANDSEDGDVTASLSWISDIDGTIGTGGTFSISDLSVGAHTITAMGMDSGGLSGSDQITITVIPLGGTNQPPTAVINAPADGATFNEGDSITFTGAANDSEDGDVTASLSWISDIDGTIGTGGTFSISDLSVGAHTITAMGMDSGGLSGSDQITITVIPLGEGATIEVRVAAGSDDAEELFSGGMQLSSTDLDLGSKTVGVRFSSVNIPQGASIINAYLQFQADEIGTAASSLTIEGQDADDAPTFTGAGGDITSRSRTITTVSWSPAPWTSAGAVGPDQRTPNIALIIEEIVSRPFWSSGNSLVLIITGSGGERAAYSREGNQAGAPLLHVEYTLGAGTNQPPTAVINAPADGATFNEGDSITFTGAANDSEDGDVTASLSWISDIDGTIGTGGTFSISDLSVGAHTITAMGMDSGGLSGSDQITITVIPLGGTNQPPTAVINAPADGATFNEGDSITFTGAANDSEDGDVTASLSWISDIDGTIGTGGTFSISDLSVGAHTITAMGMDSGGLSGSDQITITVIPLGEGATIEVRVAAGSDDAEELFSGGMQLSSTDLDLGSKTVGVRFSSVNIPQGASIINAYLQFQADEIGTAASSLTIEGQDADDAPTFTGAGGDITSRSRTITTVSWSPAPWTSAGAVGPDQRTPNIALIIEEIVSRPFWSSGNSLVLIITGSGGERAAYSREGNQAGAPLLHVEYTLGAGTNQPPTAVINAPADGATFNEGDSITFTGAANDSEDGDVTASLSWISDIDGTIGTGGTFSISDLSVGAHTITAMGMDSGGLSGSDQITITVIPLGEGATIEVRVAAGSDDAEELFSGGMQLSSTDLDLGSKTVGVRFSSVNIPQGASIINAYLQFQADEIGTAASSLTIEGQDADDAPTFTGAGGDITSRSRTTTAVSWSPAPWTSAGAVGPDQRTPNIALIIEEIVSRPFWSSGNSLMLIITGSGGERAASSLEGNQAGAPLLHVEYTTN